jgi:hypothetical protein
MSQENPLWGAERVRGELLRLGIAVSTRSIRRYRWRSAPRSPSQTWATFLRNHARAIWAADLLTVPTLTFKTLYVLFFIAHGRRELVYFQVTAHPTAAWVWRPHIKATPWGRQPPYLPEIATASTAATSPPIPRPWGRRVPLPHGQPPESMGVILRHDRLGGLIHE